MSDLSKGIILVCISVLASALMALFYKLIPPDISVFTKLLARGVASVVIAYSLIYALRRKLKSKEQDMLPAYFAQQGNVKLMLLRCLMGCLGILSYIYVVNELSLSDADMLTKLATVFIILIGAFFLKADAINKVQVFVVFISLLGAGLIIKPSFANPLLGSYFIGILQAIFAAISYLCIRYLLTKVERKEHPLTIESSLALFTVLFALYPAISQFSGWEGKGLAYLYLAIATLFALIAQYTFSFAMKFAPAVEVNVYQYLSLLWSSLFGWLFFAFIPDFFSLLGYLLILAGGLVLYVYNLRLYRQNKKKAQLKQS
ncbi:hypothetical protein CJP74_01510 [Psittacicella melopsittaci]|uniref:EamA domain-containing protein n=1 Tax=Psittacicella melopsittaci TaxID=2028576 RepID=A0A3A1Y8N5_9GAMM|nr:DMT family transporter [Psittacicella melopsittaci]RIY33569.1 hypothetical protein CJP74_01510 [Psittacicella melopsittaci]